MQPSQKIWPQAVEHGETNVLMQIGQLKVGSFATTFSGTGLLALFLCHVTVQNVQENSVTTTDKVGSPIYLLIVYSN